ncbi:hypothetical protein PLESTB_000114200 [Pleodorina starrii]|uniref:Uncharacterized protein n=1 Tax=Pleodorina starrii TaxID=330485 RepID=A0A9W6BAP0_9CHLO|nr:hypothetical protein PLESTM_000109800 [Pleodorina starrii]GLC48588.1 hypothetical protein PLESTB_000114200 [Pleodorina starrii]
MAAFFAAGCWRIKRGPSSARLAAQPVGRGLRAQQQLQQELAAALSGCRFGQVESGQLLDRPRHQGMMQGMGRICMDRGRLAQRNEELEGGGGTPFRRPPVAAVFNYLGVAGPPGHSAQFGLLVCWLVCWLVGWLVARGAALCCVYLCV